MNKKAIFTPILSFFILIILGSAYYVIVIKNSDDKSVVLGINQVEILKSYNTGEKYYTNLEQITKYSLDKTINNFTKYSGVKELCKNNWVFDEECNPNLENNFVDLFKEELDYYGYKNEEVSIENNFLIIKSNFNYKYENKGFKFEYNLPSVVKRELKIDFNKLNKLKEEIKRCLINSDEKDKVNNCISNDYDHKQNGNIITFKIPIEKKIILYENKIETKKLDFTFNIDLDNNGIVNYI
jgi:hypothetical protein